MSDHTSAEVVETSTYLAIGELLLNRIDGGDLEIQKEPENIKLLYCFKLCLKLICHFLCRIKLSLILPHESLTSLDRILVQAPLKSWSS